ncbi:MAG: 5-(carboxyamino)imidazole ribonucleotide mutase [Bacteroidota bacterium]
MPPVAIMMGSQSDEEIMKGCEEYLTQFGISFETKILSAHRQPDETAQYAREAASRGIQVIIAAAGMAAHLPGVVASLTTLPVIGVPLPASELRGVDALYSIVQMPAGIPVATVSIGKTGARSAAVLAAEIIALQDSSVREKLVAFKKNGSKF